MKKEKEVPDIHMFSTRPWPKGFLVPENYDPLGSYTGVAADPKETPVQDADDL